MALAHQSIATINSPQFINLEPLDINPLMSSCQIKVFYLGKNRNRSYISKQVATEMAKSLRGAPIVGYFKKDKQDFGDHGEQLIIDGDGFHFNCLTMPYGFVAPDAKVWFKDFEDQDEFGNSVVRTYLMTTGYLWTSQFEQAQKIINEGKTHSMELDEKTLQGHWSTDLKEEIDFFIINDAIFSKLCILGDDVEPCFEGSAVTAPQVSASFTLDDNFKHTLFEMMQELKNALKGGNTVADIKDKVPEIQTEEVSTDFTAENQEEMNESSSAESTFEKKEEEKKEEAEEENKEEDQKEEDKDKKKGTNFADDDNEDDEDDEDDDEDQNENENENENDNSSSKKTAQDDDNKGKKKYTELEDRYNSLQSAYTELQAEVDKLRSFKEDVENQQKEDLISQFYMLSEEDKKDVVENKNKYSLDEIKSKLAVICFEKKVNFNLDSSEENENSKRETEETVTTFNIENREDSTPEWIKAVESTSNNRF